MTSSGMEADVEDFQTGLMAHLLPFQVSIIISTVYAFAHHNGGCLVFYHAIEVVFGGSRSTGLCDVFLFVVRHDIDDNMSIR